MAMNDLTSCVEAFEESIAAGNYAPIELFLPEPSHPDYESIVLELARVELESRGRQSGVDTIEGYRIRFPTVFSNLDSLSQIAFEEFRVRRQQGEDVDRREYSVRFEIDTSGWPVVAPLPSRSLESAHFSSDHHHSSAEAALARDRRLLLPGFSEVAGDQLREWLETAFPEFELGEELGKGAFGRVFLASQKDLANRLVVIKVTSDTTAEPERLAKLQHTNIVPVYSVHRTPEWQAICMPYFGRRTLRDFIDNQSCHPQHTFGRSVPAVGKCDAQVRVETTFRLVEQVATGLHHAHCNGVLHRDVKPANILVTDEGQALLLDFNLSSDLVAHSLTRSVVGGTLPYLAPEHLESLQNCHPITVQADIYSVGGNLFRTFTWPTSISTQTGCFAE